MEILKIAITTPSPFYSLTLVVEFENETEQTKEQKVQNTLYEMINAPLIVYRYTIACAHSTLGV